MQFRKLKGELHDEGNSKEYLATPQGRHWSAAVYAFVRFLGTLDDLVIATPNAGEAQDDECADGDRRQETIVVGLKL